MTLGEFSMTAIPYLTRHSFGCQADILLFPVDLGDDILAAGRAVAKRVAEVLTHNQWECIEQDHVTVAFSSDEDLVIPAFGAADYYRDGAKPMEIPFEILLESVRRSPRRASGLQVYVATYQVL
jgi:hypothetical protein